MNCEIDLYDLFDAVTEDYFFYKAVYQRTCADPNKTEPRRGACHRDYERAKCELERVSDLLGFDAHKLIALHRLLFRWCRVRRWARTFPMKDHYDAIMGYVSAGPALREGAAA